MKQILALILTISLGLVANGDAWADSSGSFRGASNHVTTGTVQITKNADGTHTVTLSGDFSLDGAPDPQVGFGKNGTFSPAANLGKLKKLRGGQSYVVPANIDPEAFNELYIYCVRFDVPLGVAALS
ncbi:MAG: DM13 domain-containing protein [Pseudomonadota bacterium]